MELNVLEVLKTMFTIDLINVVKNIILNMYVG